MSLRIDPVHGRSDLRAFLRFPWNIYRGDPAWVPPILRQVAAQFDRSRYPFFRRGEVEPFIARRDGRPVGRIVAILNRAHLEAVDDGLGFFGFLEMEEDPEVAAALIEAAGEWLRSRGIRRMLGPVNFTTNDTCGVLVEGFEDPPAILMPYNPPYYGPLLEKTGLEVAKNLLAYRITPEVVVLDRFRRIAERARRKGFRVRKIDFGAFESEIERARSIYNDAWSANWGFEQMDREEFHAMARDLRRAADPRLILLAEADGEAVGFAVSIPDLNPAIRKLNGRLTPWGLLAMWLAARRVERIRTLILGVRPAYRRRGVDALLGEETVSRAIEAGYRSAELSWILEENVPMNQAILAVGGVVSKRYRLYEGDVGAGASRLPR